MNLKFGADSTQMQLVSKRKRVIRNYTLKKEWEGNKYKMIIINLKPYISIK